MLSTFCQKLHSQSISSSNCLRNVEWQKEYWSSRERGRSKGCSWPLSSWEQWEPSKIGPPLCWGDKPSRYLCETVVILEFEHGNLTRVKQRVNDKEHTTLLGCLTCYWSFALVIDVTWRQIYSWRDFQGHTVAMCDISRLSAMTDVRIDCVQPWYWLTYLRACWEKHIHVIVVSSVYCTGKELHLFFILNLQCSCTIYA